MVRPPLAAATTYTVKAGDTLEKIAARLYGDASQWRRIYDANRELLKTPNRIYPGQKLAIPARPGRSPSVAESASDDELK